MTVDELTDERRGNAAASPRRTPDRAVRSAEPSLALDIDALSPRETDVIALMAQGLTNHGIARRLWMSERTVESHVTNVFVKLGIAPGRDDHRRVLAVLAFIGHGRRTPPPSRSA